MDKVTGGGNLILRYIRYGMVSLMIQNCLGNNTKTSNKIIHF